MEIYRFDSNVGHKLDRYGSAEATISNIVRLKSDVMVNCMYIDRDGLVGYHQAAASQLFLVVNGEGWVRGESEKRIPIRAGGAAYWGKGEWHESGSKGGMTVIIIEADVMNPDEFMPLLS